MHPFFDTRFSKEQQYEKLPTYNQAIMPGNEEIEMTDLTCQSEPMILTNTTTSTQHPNHNLCTLAIQKCYNTFLDYPIRQVFSVFNIFQTWGGKGWVVWVALFICITVAIIFTHGNGSAEKVVERVVGGVGNIWKNITTSARSISGSMIRP